MKVAKVGGIESAGMFCGPKEMGWDTDILDGDLAIMLADSAEVGSPAPPYEEAVAAFQQREKEAKQKQEEEAKAAAAASAKDDKKGKKKKGQGCGLGCATTPTKHDNCCQRLHRTGIIYFEHAKEQ